MNCVPIPEADVIGTTTSQPTFVIGELPYNISQAGKYVLESNLTFQSQFSLYAIDINFGGTQTLNGVTVDFQGFSIYICPSPKHV